MRLIGLTGGIAPGKTAVSHLLAARGAAIIDTDLLAREVVEPGNPAYQDIVGDFGEGVLRPDGALDRAKLGAVVFADAEARRRLNGYTHPRIRQLMMERVAALQASATPPPAAVLVIPLLFENGLDALVEESWLVKVDPEVQKERLMRRDGFSPAEAEQRIASQMPLAEKLERATRVIDNSGDLSALDAEVDRVWQEAALG
ncbi:MAG: dephospho-CoA kinase [Candidatus Sericytochromatia bacterium]